MSAATSSVSERMSAGKASQAVAPVANDRGHRKPKGPAGKTQAYVCLSRGWALGTAEFKNGMLKDNLLAADARAWTREGAQALRQARWAVLLRKGLACVGRTPAQAASDRKGAPWKIALAAWMKTRTQVPNGWLSAQLHLGSPNAFSRNLTACRRNHQSSDRLRKRLRSIPAA
jgi:putative transposase